MDTPLVSPLGMGQLAGACRGLPGDTVGKADLQVQHDEGDEFPALLVGTGLVLASLILVPALAQRVGLGASVTIALRGVLMRAANRA